MSLSHAIFNSFLQFITYFCLVLSFSIGISSTQKYAEANDKKFSRMMFEAIGDEAKSDPDLAAAILERTGQKSGKHSDIASKLAGDTVVHNRTYFTLLQKVTAYYSFVVCIL